MECGVQTLTGQQEEQYSYVADSEAAVCALHVQS